MASIPTLTDVHYDQPLTNISVAFGQQTDVYFHSQVFPEVPVANKSDKYWVFPRGKLLRPTARVRAPGAESAGGGFDLAPSGYYSCDPWALHKDIDDMERANQDPAVDLDRSTTRYLTQQMLLTRELQWVNNYLVPGVWSSNVTPAIPWDQPGSTPIADLRKAVKFILMTTGLPANVIAFNRDVWDVVQDHPDFIARVMFGQVNQPAIVAKNLLAQLLGVDNIVVGSAIYNTTNSTSVPGSDLYQFMSPPHVLVAYAAPEPALETPSAGYQFVWSGYLGMQGGQRMLKMRIDPRHSDRLEIESAFSMGLVSADCGYLIQNAVTATPAAA